MPDSTGDQAVVRQTLARLQTLVAEDRIRITDHGDEELSEDRIPTREAVQGLASAEVIEFYPDTGRGPSVLCRQLDASQRVIHVVWAIAYNHQTGPAVLVTAYRPDPARWNEDFRRRRS